MATASRNYALQKLHNIWVDTRKTVSNEPRGMIVSKKTFGVVHGHSARTSGYDRAVPGRLEKDTGLTQAAYCPLRL